MKLTLIALFAAAAAAQTTALKAGETKCPCAMPGGSSKCAGTATDRHEVCSWLQQCYTASNISYSMCIKKGNQVCTRHRWLGSSGSIVAAKEHHPSKICCEEESCTSRQACVEKEGGTGTFEYEYGDSVTGATTVMESFSLDDIARNNWKTKKGTGFLNKPRVCIDRVFDMTQAAKQIVAPGLSIIFCIFMILVGCCKRQVALVFAVLPVFVITTSIFLSLTEGFAFALFSMLVAAATMTTPAEQKGKLVIFQVTYAWLYFGGTNFFFQIGTLSSYFTIVSTKTLPEVEKSCTKYFNDYYAIVDAWKAWDTDATTTTWGLCDREYVRFLILVAYAQAFALFLMVAITLLAYLTPTDMKGVKVVS